jgi:hypothetical protein
MTKEQVMRAMREHGREMKKLVDEFNLHPKDDFIPDAPDITVDLTSGGGGGYPKFSALGTDEAPASDQQKRWVAIVTQLVKLIANPHIGRDDIKAVFRGFGLLGELYAEKFMSEVAKPY